MSEDFIPTVSKEQISALIAELQKSSEDDRCASVEKNYLRKNKELYDTLLASAKTLLSSGKEITDRTLIMYSVFTYELIHRQMESNKLFSIICATESDGKKS